MTTSTYICWKIHREYCKALTENFKRDSMRSKIILKKPSWDCKVDWQSKSWEVALSYDYCRN